MCPQLPPFLLGSKFPKKCEWGEREISLKSYFVAASPLRVVNFLSESVEWVFSAEQLMVGWWVTLMAELGQKGVGAARESGSAPGFTLCHC